MDGVNAPASAVLFGCTLTALGGTNPLAADAQSRTAVASYIVTTAGATGAGGVVVREALSLARVANGGRLALAGPDGTVLSTPVAFSPRGEIASNAQDGAVTCYNMAVDALDAAQRTSADPARVFARFGKSVVGIPLHAVATQTRAGVRTTALTGVSTGVFSTDDGAVDAGIIIEATVTQDAQGLHAASFDERHYVTTPANVVERSTCVLQRSQQRPKLTPA
jgi:hypothetical protein